MQTNQDGIVLLAKKPGPTSFSSLTDIKKALGTTKVGHTGTLDSFAQGLLVVCTGRLTKLAGNITEFNKSYKAVIKFGEETDTYELTGSIIKTTDLPDLESVKKAIAMFTGPIMQRPPAFSAIHIDGKRSSDLMRQGKSVEVPLRPVTVFSAELLDYKLNKNNKVEYVMIDFTVSKGTYIRSLAKDIGETSGSSAHLIGLYRTSVGNFSVNDAAGFSSLSEFSIDSCIDFAQKFNSKEIIDKKIVNSLLQQEILEKIQTFKEDTATLCGFINIHIENESSYKEFINGKPLKNRLFVENLYDLPCNSLFSVFYNNVFAGLIEKNTEGRISYKFVIN